MLDPIDRVSEALFGLIMVLTFTGSLSAAEAGRADVRDMLVGALGCNLAWGIIDGVFYLMGCLAERGRALLTWRAVRAAVTPEAARGVIADALPPLVAKALSSLELEKIRLDVKSSSAPPPVASLHRRDWLGAAAVFLWVFLATFPVTIPFMIMQDVMRAMRVSNGIAVGLLFITGYAFGRYAGFRRPWMVGVSMVLLGSILVTLTIALGG